MRSRPFHKAPVAAGAALAGLLIGTILAGGLTGAAAEVQGQFVKPPEASQSLEEVAKAIDKAKGKEPGSPAFHRLIVDAETSKHEFVSEAFAGQSMFGCRVPPLFRTMLELDVSFDPIGLIYLDPDTKKELAEDALQQARVLRLMIGACGGRRQKQIAAKILGEVREPKGKSTGNPVASLKHDLLKDERVYGCSAYRFYLFLFEVDGFLWIADHKEKRNYLDDAFRYLDKLADIWELVPCGEGTVPPPDGDGTTPPTDDGGGGGGTTPETSKTAGPFPDSTGFPDNCYPGFFIDVFIPANAQNPTHVFDPGPPCPGATVTVTVYPAGTQPPNQPSGENSWMTKQTYRVEVTSSTSGAPAPFSLKVSWTNP